MDTAAASPKACCPECGAVILADTAARTGGRCMPCWKLGSLESKRWVRWLRRLVPVLALGCLALVSTIEVLNYQCGDAIARKMAQEPRSKWRILLPRAAWMLYQRDFQSAKGLDPATPLASADQGVFQAYARSRWRAYLPDYWLRWAMKYCVWGVPAGLFTVVASLFLLGRSRAFWRAVLWTSCLTGAMTFLTVLFRYWPTLGW